ncbi:MAG: 50S ribosomal protein L22 [Acidimicrobiales bacterium]
MATAVGTRAQAKYVRMSASKVRVVLDLIRGENVARADEILEFSERGSSVAIRKVLASAVANAENNDGQLAEELFVSECYADEGPTIKRWRPRARGRATKINKRTCHITVIVERLSLEDLELATLRAESKGKTTDPSETRRRRVARSKAVDESADESVDEVVETEDAAVEAVDEAVEVEAPEVEVEDAEAEAPETEAVAESDSDEPAEAEDTTEKED